MYIKVPVIKKPRKPSAECASRALATYLGRKRCFANEVNGDKYDIKIEGEYVYYPYWVGSVWTLKERALPIYPAKEIVFYAVADGIAGSYIVLRNVPKTEKMNYPEDKVLPTKITEKKLMGEILDEAITERINKQFIFGAPQSRKQESDLIYLPMVKVQIKGKDQRNYKDYYVNAHTGEVKTI